MPPYLPFHLELIYISGFFQILGGIGILIPRVRTLAGYGLILLLTLVFPANVYMLFNNVEQEGWTGAVQSRAGVCFMAALRGEQKDLAPYFTDQAGQPTAGGSGR